MNEFLIGGHNYTLAECTAFGMAGAWVILDRKQKGATDVEAVFTPSIETSNTVNNSYGLHLTIDFKNVSRMVAADPELVGGFMQTVPESVGMQVLFPPVTTYYNGGEDPDDSGVTSVVGLTTSHASIHLYDKKAMGYFDLFSCKLFDPAQVIKEVTAVVGSSKFDVQLLVRGRRLGSDASIRRRNESNHLGDE